MSTTKTKPTDKKKLTSEQYDALSVVTPKGVLSYPHVFKKGEYQGKETNYNFTLLIDKGIDISELRKRLTLAKVLEWGKDQAKWPQNNPKTKAFYNRAIKDGDALGQPETAGKWVISATSANPFPAVDRAGNEILNEKDLYGGCICRANIQAATYYLSDKNMGEKFYAKALKKIDEGKKLGNGGKSLSAFDGLDDDEDSTSDSESYEAESEGDDADMGF